MGKFSTKCPFHVFMAGALSVGALWVVSKLLSKKSSIVRHPMEDYTRFSNSISYDKTVYISGQTAEEGSTIQEQTKNALIEVEKALAQAGTDKSKVLEVTIWLADITKDYDGMNEVYDKWVVPGSPPCRACVQAKLCDSKYLVEIRVIAAL